MLIPIQGKKGGENPNEMEKKFRNNRDSIKIPVDQGFTITVQLL